jgi:Cd2+/Zn2+-exporting ATPase
MVEEAQAQKAPAEKFVDQFARIYTPAVVALAVLVAVVPPILFGAPFLPSPFGRGDLWPTGGHGGEGDQGWLYRALELLVVACPCALVISTPVVLVSAISNAARNGVLIKGGVYLELLSRVNAIAFDKTGTLTEGRPRVIEVKSVACQPAEKLAAKENCPSCENLLALASAVERRSEHPLAKAVVTAAEQGRVSAAYPAAEDVKAITGKGVIGTVDGRDVLIGSHAYFDQVMPHDRAQCAAVEAAAAQGRTALLVGADDAYLGYITVADAVRESSKRAIAKLKRAGVSSLVMLTGDNAATAATIAAEVGVTEVKANLLPEHKVDVVKALLAEHGTVAMVGDGINDAPALATASLGIAMGAGTAQALETADIALMGNDLTKLPFAIWLSRAAMRTIKANIAFAVGVKLAFLALVLMGLGTMWLAVLADVGAALVVTLFGMRLLKWTPKPA